MGNAPPSACSRSCSDQETIHASPSVPAGVGGLFLAIAYLDEFQNEIVVFRFPERMNEPARNERNESRKNKIGNRGMSRQMCRGPVVGICGLVVGCFVVRFCFMFYSDLLSPFVDFLTYPPFICVIRKYIIIFTVTTYMQPHLIHFLNRCQQLPHLR